MKDINEGLALYHSTPGAVLVDLRDPEDYRAGHIPGAISMKQETIREDMPRVAKFTTPIFLYDYNEKRADPAEAFLRSKGYNEARSIGGILFYNGEWEKPPLTVRELREKLGLTQAQFAAELDVSTITISALETARMKVSSRLSDRIREKYGEQVISTSPETVSKREETEKKAPGESIRELRASLGLTRESFAKSLGLNAHTIYQYESGRIEPSKKALARIKKEYGLKIVREREKTRAKKIMNHMDVKEIRTALGLSQAEFAKGLGVGPASIGHYENGRMNPSDRVIAQIKAVYGKELQKALASPAQDTAHAPADQEKPSSSPRIIVRLPSGQEISMDDLLQQAGQVDAICLNMEENRICWVRGRKQGILNCGENEDRSC